MTQHSPRDGAPRRRWLALVWLFGIALLAVSTAGAGWMMRSHAGQQQAAAGPAAGATPSALLYCIGHVDVENGVSYPYPVAPGRVVEVKAREGQAFKAGEVLFRTDDRAARKDVERAEHGVRTAELGTAKANNDRAELAKAVLAQRQAIEVAKHDLEAAQIAARRKHDLVDKNALVKEEAEAADALVRKAEAAVKGEERKLDAIEARGANIELAAKLADAEVADRKFVLEKAKLALDECAVKAPADGTVLRLAVQAGDLLGPEAKSPPLVFCPAGPRVVRAEVEQEWAGRVQDGQVATIQDDTSSGSGPAWTGKVVRLSDWMAHRRSILPDPSQLHDIRTLECIIALDPGQPPLRIGQRVRVALSNP
jgi:multidrug resistance efflux pump